MREGDRLAVAVLDFGEGHIYAFQHLERVGSSARRVGEHSEHLLGMAIQGILAHSVGIFQCVTVGFQRGVCHHFREFFLVNGENFRTDERGNGGEADIEVGRSSVHCLISRVAVIDVHAEHGVNIKHLNLLRDPGNQIHCGFHAGNRFPERTREGGDFFNFLRRLFICGFPRRVVGEDIGEIPCKFFFCFGSCLQCHRKHHPFLRNYLSLVLYHILQEL